MTTDNRIIKGREFIHASGVGLNGKPARCVVTRYRDGLVSYRYDIKPGEFGEPTRWAKLAFFRSAVLGEWVS